MLKSCVALVFMFVLLKKDNNNTNQIDYNRGVVCRSTDFILQIRWKLEANGLTLLFS